MGILDVFPEKEAETYFVLLQEISQRFSIPRRELKQVILKNDIEIHHWKIGHLIAELDYDKKIYQILIARLEGKPVLYE